MKGKTSIVIAHHLATIVHADIIFVVKDNQIAESGTHEELLAAGGFYSELYNLQYGEQVAG
jgi:ABC-type multidrug transport system fused ATPase/permease subunit